MSAVQDDPQDPPGRLLGRRAFFGMVGVGLSGLLWGGSALRAASDAGSVLPNEIRNAIPFGGGWRIYAVNPPYPRFDPHAWRLRIDGLVEHPVELSYAELRALPRAEQVSDFHCVTGWSVDGVRWTGVRFAELLALARPRPAARALTFTSAEQPYVDSLTLAQLRAPDAMLALRHGPGPADARARRAGTRGDAADVRLQGRQVAGAHHGDRPRAGRLLGAAGL